jgi:nitrite reductase/ring-hydroxylating ferredoxin subunit
MIEIAYTKIVAYPLDVTLSQYFDYEHIPHVHPLTLGEYRLVERDGNLTVYDQVWPAGWFGGRATTRVRHVFEPPSSMSFEFVAGRYRGVIVRTKLEAHPEGTLVREAYEIPLLPSWGWLAALIRPPVMRLVERIWKEDLDVQVCMGGWPGIPGPGAPPAPSAARAAPVAGQRVAGAARDCQPGAPHACTIGDREVVVVAVAGGYRAVSARCPHTGGPLALGRVDNGTIVCPWHGARFDLASGASMCQTTRSPLDTFTVVRDGDDLVVAAALAG